MRNPACQRVDIVNEFLSVHDLTPPGGRSGFPRPALRMRTFFDIRWGAVPTFSPSMVDRSGIPGDRHTPFPTSHIFNRPPT